MTKESDSSNTIDSNSELFIHHGDVSSNFMLATQKLNGDNYGEWKRAAEISLSAKNKLGFVNGTCVKPTTNSSQLNYRERCNNLVLSWILHPVEPEIGRSILYYQTAAEVWNELQERYAQSNAPRKYQVHKHIGSISQGHNSVAVYYTELKTSWNEYMSLLSLPTCSCGSGTAFLGILQEQQVMHFLMGLNDDYKPIRGNILMMQSLPNLSQAYRLILQEEKQRECNSSFSIGVDSTALAAPFQKNFNNKPVFQQGNRPFNPKWNNSTSSVSTGNGNGQGVMFGMTPSGKKSKFFYDHCKVFGHSMDRCFKIHGYPKDKGKRAGHCVQTGRSDIGFQNGMQGSMSESDVSADSGHAMLTQDQVNQLMSLLSQHHLDPNNAASLGGSGTSSAFLAGAFNEAASGSW